MDIYVPYDYKQDVLALLDQYPIPRIATQLNTTNPTYHYSLETEAFYINMATVGGKTTLFLKPPETLTHNETVKTLKAIQAETSILGLSKEKEFWYLTLNYFPVNFTGVLQNGKTQFYPDQNPTNYIESDILQAVIEADTFIQAVIMLETGLPKATVEVMPMEWVIPLVYKELQ